MQSAIAIYEKWQDEVRKFLPTRKQDMQKLEFQIVIKQDISKENVDRIAVKLREMIDAHLKTEPFFRGESFDVIYKLSGMTPQINRSKLEL